MAPPTGPTDPSNPHDALFRNVFARVEHAAAELQAVLPSALLSSVNLSTLRLAPGSFVDAELTSSQSDLLFTVEVRGGPGFLYLLFEHQSSVDELMAFRMLKYVVRVLDQHVTAVGDGRKALPLPIVIPVVLHHSATGWTTPTRLEQLFDPDLVAEVGILAHVPRLGFVLDDISRLTDDELTRRALGLLPTLALWALRDARRPGRVHQSLSRWSATMRALAEADTGGEALITLFRYLSLVVEDLTPQTLVAALAPAPPERKEKLMTTMAQRWMAEGEARGEAKGRVEGRVEGARRALLQLLGLKFGELPGPELQRIESASEDELLRWTARVLSAEALGDVLAE